MGGRREECSSIRWPQSQFGSGRCRGCGVWRGLTLCTFASGAARRPDGKDPPATARGGASPREKILTAKGRRHSQKRTLPFCNSEKQSGQHRPHPSQ